jgi:glycine/D-amino acid oxidase-like deaminating enzyme
MVQGPAQHGIPGLVNLFGIESPGLTASLPLAELAASLALGQKPSISAASEAA